LQPVIVIAFDQAVSPERMLAATQLTADGNTHALRLAMDDEVAADTVATVLMNNAEPGRQLALRPVQPLPQSADVRITIGAAAMSSVGTRAASVAQELRFRTHGPLDIAWHGCYH